MAIYHFKTEQGRKEQAALWVSRVSVWGLCLTQQTLILLFVRLKASQEQGVKNPV